jgi:CBS domain containing-hemolysin-like protein
MFSFIIALILIFAGLLAIALRKTYYFLPPKELKRQARAGDPLAKVLFRAVAYGASLRVLLWAIIVVAFAASFVLFAHIVPSALAFIVEVVVIAYGFAWMPHGRMTRVGADLAAWSTPAIAWMLNYVHPFFDRAISFVQKHRPVHVHTGLYEREDLLALLEQQKGQPDSRFSHEELDLFMHTLTFGQKMVREIMVPRRVVRSISEAEPIGPMLMKDLHDTGHSRFPVYQDKEENIVGTLYLRDLVTLKHTGHVRNVMEQAVYYVHEEYPLEQVLHAFIKTQHHLFIVVNSFEEYVGIITIEDILEQILGCRIIDEFDHYDDLRAVAANHARIEHKKRQKNGEELLVSEPDVSEKEVDTTATQEAKSE